MPKNVGLGDRVARIAIGLALAIMIYFGAINDVAAIIAGIAAAYFLLSGLLARCLVYKAASIDTSVQEQPYSTTDDRSGL